MVVEGGFEHPGIPQQTFKDHIIQWHCAMDTPGFMRCLFVYLKLDLGNGLPEGLALDDGDLGLDLVRGTRAVSTGEGTSAPGRS